MRNIHIEVPGDPVPWAPKATNQRSGNRFMPNRQAEAIGRVLDAVKRAELPIASYSADLALELGATFYVRRPKSHYGTGKNANQIKPRFEHVRPTGKPDLSNLLKLVEDGLVLSGLIPDDDQIVGIFGDSGKWYTESREEQPRSRIFLRVAEG